MTVQAVPPFKRYAANGVAPTYTIPFLIIEAGDLRISLNGVPVTTDFILTGIGLPQSSCTFLTPPAGDLLFTRVIPLHRLVDYQNAGDFLAQTVNRDFDRIWLVLQGLALDDLRALRVPPEEIEGIHPVPARAIRATKMLAFDGAGEPIVSNLTMDEIERSGLAANEAEYYANLARQWASNPEDVPVIPPYYSAFHWAMKSMQAATPPRRYAGPGIIVLVDTILTPGQVGSWVDVNSNSLLTLPAINSVPVGSTFVIRNSSPSFEWITVNSLGGNVGGVGNFSMGNGELIEFVADPGKGWWITSRSQAYEIFAGNLIGTPIPFPLSTVPPGYLAMSGQAFNPATYPDLSVVYPSNFLPDLRGEFIRGWDNARGVDPGRTVLSYQACMIERHEHPADIAGRAYFQGNDIPGVVPSPGTTGAAGGSETRPRNIAFHYICRAR
jgi:hypothetical protein